MKKQNQELQQKYKIRGYPTVVLVDVEGTEFGRTGYRPGGPSAFIKSLQEALDKKGE